MVLLKVFSKRVCNDELKYEDVEDRFKEIKGRDFTEQIEWMDAVVWQNSDLWNLVAVVLVPG